MARGNGPKNNLLKRIQEYIEKEQKPEPLPRRFARLSKKGEPKGFQFDPEALRFFGENWQTVVNFLNIRLQARHSERPVQSGSLSVELFDPKDESRFHNYLYHVRLRGRNFFVKEVLNPSVPMDAASQFALHDYLSQLSHQMAQWKARVLPYRVGWKSRTESFAVSDWVQGISLEKWLHLRPGLKGDEVYQRFLRAERFLKREGVRDVTTRNTLYNTKTDELIFIDLYKT